MKKALGFLIVGLLAFTLVGCESKDWSGKYEVTNEKLDDSGIMYVNVKVEGVTDEDSLKSFIKDFKAKNSEYTAHDSLFIKIDDGGKLSNYKVANTAKGSAQTGLDKNTEAFEYKE
ncbi:hypothetical protein [Priestia taiwanensis]|uniref:DUF1307 domain-containing protein n=1 Tax=Priestia taiwanensis TaxID=1347902 RepID=A0A917EPV9_9BACI|nr:hypothetical protein [Priestia taiwanensis]MBM7362666.1 hypothetical protein [Priestia taiwanensis]GGE64057.1 hypothetical protein GCM10007140_12920 [Priestia taiwanensis]